MEPAGALGVAGARKWLLQNEFKNKNVVAVTSGANVDFDRLRFISERADANEALIAIEIPETPGSFHELYKCIFPRNVTEFSYRFANNDSANIILSFQARDSEDYHSVISNLQS